MDVRFGDIEVVKNGSPFVIINNKQAKQPIHIYDSSFDTNQFSHFMVIYRDDSTNQNKNIKSKYIQYLVYNIPGFNISQGNILFPYYPPQSNNGQKIYRIEIYRQSQLVDINMPILVQRFDFHLDSITSTFPLVSQSFFIVQGKSTIK